MTLETVFLDAGGVLLYPNWWRVSEALAAQGHDLVRALQKSSGLRRQMNRVRTIYLPTSLVNCVFQQFRR